MNLPWNGVLEFDYVSTSRPTSLNTPTISEENFEILLQKLGLSSRRRLPKNDIMRLLELQLAVLKDYFMTGSVLQIMDCFSADDATQVKVVVCMFSRIKNLESFDVIMRHLSSTAVQDLVQRLGWLNILNPLKPSHDFILHQRYIDNRITTLKILELAAAESGDQLKEHARSDLHLIDLYASIGRIVAEPSELTLRISYCELGERPCVPAWNKRKDLLSFFLVGTYPIDNNVYKTIQMYKEVEAAGMLGMGPIDLQYMEYQNSFRIKKSRRGGRGSGSASVSSAGKASVMSNLSDGSTGTLPNAFDMRALQNVFPPGAPLEGDEDDLSDIVTNDYGTKRVTMMARGGTTG